MINPPLISNRVSAAALTTNVPKWFFLQLCSFNAYLQEKYFDFHGSRATPGHAARPRFSGAALGLT
jgi:hypothetical protein